MANSSEVYEKVKEIVRKNDVQSGMDRIYYRPVYFSERKEHICIAGNLIGTEVTEEEERELLSIPEILSVEKGYSVWRISFKAEEASA